MRWIAVGSSFALACTVGCSDFVGVADDAPDTSDPSANTTEATPGSTSTSVDPTSATGSATSASVTSTTDTPTSGSDSGEVEPPMTTSSSSGAQPEACNNEEVDGNESDVDCGGRCARCEFGEHCNDGTDCSTGFCSLDSVCSLQPPLIWLDGLDPDTLFNDSECTTSPPTDGQQIYCWENKGLAAGTFEDSGGQPLYREALDGIEFDNAPMVSDEDIFGDDLDDVTIFVVQRELSSRNSFDFNLNHPHVNGNRYSVHIPWGNSNRHVVWDVGGTSAAERVETPTDIIATGETHLFGFVNSADEDARAIRIDGEEIASSNGNLAADAGEVAVGRDAHITVFEFRVYAPSPSPAHRRVIEGQLACKWGLRDQLPNGHPFHSEDPEDPAGCPVALE